MRETFCGCAFSSMDAAEPAAVPPAAVCPPERGAGGMAAAGRGSGAESGGAVSVGVLVMRARGPFLSLLDPTDLTSPRWQEYGHNGRVNRIEIVV
jgi:hypothetical protein